MATINYTASFSQIVHVWMDTHKSKTKFRILKLLLKIGYSATILTNKVMSKHKLKKNIFSMLKTQAIKVTTTQNINFDFYVQEFCAKHCFMEV